MKYWAFLSYSHTDKKWSDWLHKSLETYRVPRRLVGKPSRDGVVPKRAYPVFRDREELPGSSDLGNNISSALEESRYLVVICSPNVAVSRWVNEEIKTFKSMGREDRILCLIVSGEPNATDKPELGLLECFPEAVRFRVGPDRVVSGERTEPIAADARSGKDGKHNAKLKILSGVLGVAYDELKQRDKQRRIRRRVQLTTAALLLCALIGGIFTWKETQRRAQQRRAASQADFANALKLLDQGAGNQVLAWLARAVRVDPSNQTARARLTSVLGQRNWPLPTTAPMTHLGPLVSAELSPNGQRVATASEKDKTLRIWDAATGKPITEPIADQRPAFVNFDSDGTRMVGAGGSGARQWDSITGKENGPLLKHFRALWMARFSPDGKSVLTASADGTARLWNAADGKERFAALPHGNQVSVAIFSPDAKRIATTSADQTVRVWDGITGMPLTPQIKLKELTYSAEFSPDGTCIAANVGGSAEIWDATTGQPALPTLDQTGVRSVHFSPDGKFILTASFDMTARIWDASNGKGAGAPLQNDEALLCASFSRDGERIVTGSKQGTGQIWDAKSRRRIGEAFQHRDEIVSANFSADGKRVLTASKDGTAQLWDATKRGLVPLVLKGATPPDWIVSASFDQDSRHVHATTHDGVVEIWDALSGKLIGTESQKAPPPASVSGNGKRRAVVSKDMLTVTVFDVATNKVSLPPIVHPAQSFVIATVLSDDGNQLLTSAIDNCVRLWDVKTGNLVFDPIKHPQFVRSVSFSKDGNRILTGCMDRAARVWDAHIGRPLLEPLRHGEGGSVEDAQFSNDGKRIVTASMDGKAQIWDASSGQHLTEPFQHDEAAVHIARFSPDGRWLLTTVGGNAFIWDIAPLPETTPNWLPDLAEAVGGWHLNEKALLVPVDHQWEALNKIRARLSGSTNDPFARWGAWILANSENRRTSPFSAVEAPPPSPAATPVIPSRPPIAAPAGKESSEHMLMIACLQHGVFSFASLKEPAFALESYERALTLAKSMATAEPKNFGAQKDLFLVHTFMSESYVALKQTQKALVASLEALGVIEKAAQQGPSNPETRNLLGEAWGNLAYNQIVARKPTEAINSALKGLKQDPTQTLIKANLADAYLFNSEYAKAEPILREIKDVKAGDKTYADVILKSFDELKKLGIEHPDTQKAREFLERLKQPESK